MEQRFKDLATNSMEEAGEFIQAAAKCMHFGMNSRNPLDPKSPTNKEQLEIEVADFLAMVELMGDAGMIDRQRVNSLVIPKMQKKIKTMHLQSVLRDNNYVQQASAVRKAIDDLYDNNTH